MSNRPLRKVLVALSVMVTSLALTFISSPAQRRAEPRPQRQQTGPLKTVTLDGKGGVNRSNSPQAGSSRPRPLTQAQRFALFKGKVVATSSYNHFKLTPDKPVFADKAWLRFVAPKDVYPKYSNVNFSGADDISTSPLTTPHLEISFEAQVGKVYALDFEVWALAYQTGGNFTFLNPFSNAQQLVPVEESGQHLTAYVEARAPTLLFYLGCTNSWTFYSVEVTQL